MGQVIADIERNSREIIRVEVSEFKGRELINLRIWYTHIDGTYKPTQKGVALDISRFKDLKDAIDKIEEYIKDRNNGVIPEVNVPIEDSEPLEETEE